MWQLRLRNSSSQNQAQGYLRMVYPRNTQCQTPQKIDVATFDGDLTSQTPRNYPPLPEDGSAKNVIIIEGLSHSGNQTNKLSTPFKARYDRPRIIHQTHVRKI